WLAFALSLARVSAKVKDSEVPVFTIAVPAAIVPVHVEPLLLVIVRFLVPVPLAYVATTLSVLERFVVVHVSVVASAVLRVSGTNVIVPSGKLSSETVQLP